MELLPDQKGGSGGGGPDDDSRAGEFLRRSQGFLLVAFGLALGICFMVFFGIFNRFSAPIPEWQPFFSDGSNVWLIFLYGFIGGSIISGIYNILIVRRLNLFGLESTRD